MNGKTSALIGPAAVNRSRIDWIITSVRHRFAMDHGVSLDLHQRLVVDQPGDLDHGRRRADRFEELAVDRAGLAPLSDIGDVDPGPDHVGALPPRASMAAMMISIARRDWAFKRRTEPAVGLDSDGPRHEDEIALADCP